jgi:hypothetical protein
MSGMGVLRILTSVMIAMVIIVGPALFMASSPCFDCDGVCGTAATPAAIDVRTVLTVLPMAPAPRADVPPRPVLSFELPPRPLPTTA